MPTERVERWQQDQSNDFEFGGDGEGRVVTGAVGAGFGKMKGRRVERIRIDSKSPVMVVRDKDKVAGNAAEGVVADGEKKRDRWRGKNAGGGLQNLKKLP